jgi:uncharacterized membrane protein YhhN
LSRWVLFAALLAGVSYGLAPPVALAVGAPPPLPDWAFVVWKGAGVTLLALWALLAAPGRDGRWLALLLAFGAMGDVLLETHGLVIGALAFLAGHGVAIALYARHRRADLSRADLVGGLIFVIAVAGFSFALAADRALAPGVALYSAGLGAMAAIAWLSRFPRALTAAGALMFVVSDLLIFARAGRPALDILPMGLAVWGLYFAGQTLIALGGVRRIANR